MDSPSSNLIFDKCPVCERGEVGLIDDTSKFLFIKWVGQKMKCNFCNAIFKEDDEKEGEKTYQLDLSKSKEKNRYEGEILKLSEWKRGLSDLDFSIKSNQLPNLKVDNLKIILERGEKSHCYSDAEMMEERAVRVSHGGGVRVMSGVYLGSSTSESHGELKKVDNGNLLLTNKKVMFNGNFKHLEYKLEKITSLEEHEDSFEIGVSNRQKLQTFVVDEPKKWVTYIKIAIKNRS